MWTMAAASLAVASEERVNVRFPDASLTVSVVQW